MVRQYRACVVDLLALEIMCGVHVHVCYSTLSTSHPNLVCFLFVPDFLIFHLLVSSLFVVSNESRVYV